MPFTTTESPACNSIAPLVNTDAGLLMINLSVVEPFDPAVSVILPPLNEATLPLIVNGLWAAILIAPLPVVTMPSTVTAPTF